MAELVDRVRAAAVARAAQLLRTEPDIPVDYLVVDLPCTFFMLRTLRCPPGATIMPPPLLLPRTRAVFKVCKHSTTLSARYFQIGCISMMQARSESVSETRWQIHSASLACHCSINRCYTAQTHVLPCACMDTPCK